MGLLRLLNGKKFSSPTVRTLEELLYWIAGANDPEIEPMRMDHVTISDYSNNWAGKRPREAQSARLSLIGT